MAVERPIGEPNTDIEIEGVTIETPDMEVEAIEMQEDGSAIVNPEPEMTDVQFDSNLAEYIEDDETKSDSLYLLGKDIAWSFLTKTDSYIEGFNNFIGDLAGKKIAGIDNTSENETLLP